MTDYRTSNMIWQSYCDKYDYDLHIEQVVRIMSEAITLYMNDLPHGLVS